MNISRRKAAVLFAAGAAAITLKPGKLYADEKNQKLLKAQALQKGDKVALIAPGTNVCDPDDVAKAVAAVEYFGLVPVIADILTLIPGRKAVTPEERVNDLHTAFKDNSIKAVFAVRGGYGSARLLNHIDFNIIKRNPKIFVGYSDITALHIAINQKTGLVTFHGPVLLSAFNEYSASMFSKILFDNYSGELINPDDVSGIRPAFPCRTIVPGKAEGQLTGGNLTLICSLMGTEFEIETKDKILFLEDVGEAPYSIDRMLTQLRLAGKFKDIRGIVFGRCDDCTGSESTWDFSLGEVLDDQLSDLAIPVIYGVTFGHTSNQITIPYGIKAEINSDVCGIKLLENALI